MTKVTVYWNLSNMLVVSLCTLINMTMEEFIFMFEKCSIITKMWLNVNHYFPVFFSSFMMIIVSEK